MAKTKRKYKVYGNGSGSLHPLFTHSSLWEALRFIAYVFKSGDNKSLIITKE